MGGGIRRKQSASRIKPNTYNMRIGGDMSIMQENPDVQETSLPIINNPRDI